MIAAAIHDRELGAFAEWQPRYAKHGIATFPVVIDGAGKRPAVKGYLKVGSILSPELARRFPANDAFGFALGRRSQITVLDVDTNDERTLSDALARHGASPLIVRSGSYVVAPPSAGARGRYQIVQGSLDDLPRLPPLLALDFLDGQTKASATAPAAPVAAVRDGERNNSLWRACMRHALRCPTSDALLDFA